jgi:uncharacterized protein YjeT (DUF2065 family)
MQRLTFIYLASYLLVGGLGLLVVPELTLRLLLSNGSYGDVMPRLVGVFMLALGGVVLQFVRARDYRYYRYAIIARIFIIVALTALYFKARDLLFLVLDAIVLVGLLPSIYVAVQMARDPLRSRPLRGQPPKMRLERTGCARRFGRGE